MLAREGIKILEEKGYIKSGSHKEKSLPIENMPEPLQKMSADEIQVFACYKKGDMKDKLDVNNNIVLQ